MDEQHAISRATDLLQELLETPVSAAPQSRRVGEAHADALVSTGPHLFALEYKWGARADQVGAALRQLQQVSAGSSDALPLLVVPFMGDVGKRLCQEAGVSWLDLSGNAHITAPGLKIRIEGKPNRFKEPGRPANLFAPVSSRVARVLLQWPNRWFVQRELAEEADMAPGSLSKLLPRYEGAGFIERRPDGQRMLVKARDPDLLLDAWREAYDFSAHDVRRGHVVAQTGEELLQRLAEEFGLQGVEYAATGLAAAWLLAPFAMFRLVTLYLREWPGEEALRSLGFRDEPRGANVWLVLPRDEGVFYGAGAHDGIRHVSAVQTYLDLEAQPERAEEAEEELRRQRLTWSANDG